MNKCDINAHGHCDDEYLMGCESCRHYIKEEVEKSELHSFCKWLLEKKLPNYNHPDSEIESLINEFKCR